MRLYNRVLAEARVGSDEADRARLLAENRSRTLTEIASQALEAVELVRLVHDVSETDSAFRRTTGEVVLRRGENRSPELIGAVVVNYFSRDYSVDRDVGTPVLSKPTVYAGVSAVIDLNPGEDYPKHPKRRATLIDGMPVIAGRQQGYNTERCTLQFLMSDAGISPDEAVITGGSDGTVFFDYYEAMAGLINAITDAAINPDLNPLASAATA